MYVWVCTVTLISISIQSIPCSTATSVRAHGVVAIVTTLVYIQCTLINIINITATPISIEGVASIAAACVGANGVGTILDTLIHAFNTLINICKIYLQSSL